jgi:hypothetical protein
MFLSLNALIFVFLSLLNQILQINPAKNLLNYICKSAERDAFDMAVEFINRGVDVNLGSPIHIAIKNKYVFLLFCFYFFLGGGEGSLLLIH